MATEKQELERLKLIPNWPMYIVVTPGYVGIYDDILLIYKDTFGRDCHYCTKYKVLECFKDINGYYKYHYGDNVNITPFNIRTKNKLFKI